MRTKGISNQGFERIAKNIKAQEFDLDDWVTDIYDEIIDKVNLEVPKELHEDAYNELAWLLKIENG